LIVLDTNVLSEMMLPVPSERVSHWLARHGGSFTTTITQAEILYGIEMLPPGKRRAGLATAANEIFTEDFMDRTLAFDGYSAVMFPLIKSARRGLGRPISDFDAQIAAIARAHGATLATRNTVDFEGCGVSLINPWLPL
jgi:toxin FitB